MEGGLDGGNLRRQGCHVPRVFEDNVTFAFHVVQKPLPVQFLDCGGIPVENQHVVGIAQILGIRFLRQRFQYLVEFGATYIGFGSIKVGMGILVGRAAS